MCVEREAPTVMTSVLGPTSIRVTFSASNAESYGIQYTRVVGPDQQLCPDNEDTMTAPGVASPYDITNLEEFSSYDITVTAVFPGPTMIPTTVRNTTSAAGTVFIGASMIIIFIPLFICSSSCCSPESEHYCPLHFHHCWMGPSGVYRTKWSDRQLHCAVWTRRWSAE